MLVLCLEDILVLNVICFLCKGPRFLYFLALASHHYENVRRLVQTITVSITSFSDVARTALKEVGARSNCANIECISILAELLLCEGREARRKVFCH